MPKTKHTGTSRPTVRVSIGRVAMSLSHFGIGHGRPAMPTHIAAAETPIAMKASRMAQSGASRKSYAPWTRSSSSQNTNPTATRLSAYSNRGERRIAFKIGTSRMPPESTIAGIVNAPLGLGSSGNTASAISRPTAVAAKPTPASDRSPDDGSDMLRAQSLQPALERQQRPLAVPAVDGDRRRPVDLRDRRRPVVRQPLFERQREAALRPACNPIRDLRHSTMQQRLAAFQPLVGRHAR